MESVPSSHEVTWVSHFVARMVHLRGASAEPESIRLHALEVYPDCRSMDPRAAADTEFSQLSSEGDETRSEP